MNEDIIIPVTFFATIFGIVYMFLTTRNKERIAMIDKGMDVSLLKKNPNEESQVKYWVIKLGFLMIGIALGILIGSFASSYGMNEDQAYPSMILLFGGLALISSYFVENKLRKKGN